MDLVQQYGEQRSLSCVPFPLLVGMRQEAAWTGHPLSIKTFLITVKLEISKMCNHLTRQYKGQVSVTIRRSVGPREDSFLELVQKLAVFSLLCRLWRLCPRPQIKIHNLSNYFWDEVPLLSRGYREKVAPSLNQNIASATTGGGRQTMRGKTTLFAEIWENA